MKNDELWAKTLLSVYRYLERIAGAIDKIILRSGLNSANMVCIKIPLLEGKTIFTIMCLQFHKNLLIYPSAR